MTSQENIRAIVTDIEGTTSELSFVKDVLFPYAYKRLAEFVKKEANRPDVREVLKEIRQIEGNPALDETKIIELLLRWSAEDKKIKPLKALQGMIWEEGYRSQAFSGHIYQDANRLLNKWHEAGVPLYIYSSGSIHAQKLLFGHTVYGDLTPLFSGFFDTGIGSKQEEESYRKIAQHIGMPAGSILFLSDHISELDAAKKAGFSTILLDRENSLGASSNHKRVSSFAEIEAGKMP